MYLSFTLINSDISFLNHSFLSMVIGMVSGAVKFFFPIPRFFSSHLPTSIYFSPPSHALSPYPSLYLSSFHFFFFNLYLSLFILFSAFFFLLFFLLSFSPFPWIFLLFFLVFSSLSLSLSSVQNLFRIVSDLFYSPIYNYFFPQPFRCVVCLFPFHSLFFSCFFIFIFSIFQ